MRNSKCILLFFCLFILIPNDAISQDKQKQFRQGSLLFSKYQVYFAELRKNEKAVDSVEITNDSHKILNIKFINVGDHLNVRSEPRSLEPGASGMIYVEYNASKRNDLGFVTESIFLSTNDSISPQKELSVAVNLLSYFPPESYLPHAKVPIAVFDQEEFSYGTVESGAMIEHTFMLENKGKTDLQILKIKADCSCTIPEMSNSNLAPGAKTGIKVSFNSEGKSGYDMRRIMVITNDPHHHQVYLYLNGIINAVE